MTFVTQYSTTIKLLLIFLTFFWVHCKQNIKTKNIDAIPLEITLESAAIKNFDISTIEFTANAKVINNYLDTIWIEKFGNQRRYDYLYIDGSYLTFDSEGASGHHGTAGTPYESAFLPVAPKDTMLSKIKLYIFDGYKELIGNKFYFHIVPNIIFSSPPFETIKKTIPNVPWKTDTIYRPGFTFTYDFESKKFMQIDSTLDEIIENYSPPKKSSSQRHSH